MAPRIPFFHGLGRALGDAAILDESVDGEAVVCVITPGVGAAAVQYVPLPADVGRRVRAAHLDAPPLYTPPELDDDAKWEGRAALNPALDFPALERAYAAGEVLVIDDLLTNDALQQLRSSQFPGVECART